MVVVRCDLPAYDFTSERSTLWVPHVRTSARMRRTESEMALVRVGESISRWDEVVALIRLVEEHDYQADVLITPYAGQYV